MVLHPAWRFFCLINECLLVSPNREVAGEEGAFASLHTSAAKFTRAFQLKSVTTYPPIVPEACPYVSITEGLVSLHIPWDPDPVGATGSCRIMTGLATSR